MGTRVTLGHSGLPFHVDRGLKLMFVGMQANAILRVLADILPQQYNDGLHLASALVWLACFTRGCGVTCRHTGVCVRMASLGSG